MAFNEGNLNQGGYYDDDSSIIDLNNGNGISIDDIDFDDTSDNNEEDDSKNQNQNNDYNNDYNQEDNDDNEDDEKLDLISEFLKSKGITNRNSVKFENEKGEIEEYSFDDLTLEEQLEILSYQDNDQSGGTNLNLGEEEEQFLNHLKENGVSISEYLEFYKQNIINELQESQQYSQIDELSADELYIHDLKQRFPNFSEEELLEELNVAKSNEGVFERKVESLKDHYKKLEADHLEQQKELDLQRQKQQQEDIQRTILDASKEIKEISIIELEDSDIQAALDVIFQEDNDGNTALNKALNDPKTLVEVAWFISKGKESMNSIADYYRNIIKQQDDSLKKSQKTKTTVIKKTNSSVGKTKNGKSIDDIEF